MHEDREEGVGRADGGLVKYRKASAEVYAAVEAGFDCRQAIMRQLGMTRSGASNALSRLVRQGCLRASGNTHQRTYKVKKPPNDRRGSHPLSVENLRLSDKRMAATIGHVKAGHKLRPKKVIELEHAWGWGV